MTRRPRDIRFWKRATLLALFLGYAGYYFCRSNLSVAAPLLLDPSTGPGIDRRSLGLIASGGSLAYAIGKPLSGLLCDSLGGRRMFLAGMAGAIACCLLFSRSDGFGDMLAIWSVNLLVQSLGWTAVVKLTGNWFSFRRHGGVMGVLSLSFLMGDLITRGSLGWLIQAGMGWRGLFRVSAGGLLAIAMVNALLLRESPQRQGGGAPESHPKSLFSDGREGEVRRTRDIPRILAVCPAFWFAAAMAMLLTFVRETFHLWLPVYLSESAGYEAGSAAQWSLLFPLFGGVSVVAAGLLTDRISGGRRGVLLYAAFGLLSLLLLAMSLSETTDGSSKLVYVSLAALLLFGPYSFLEGVVALDLGGKRGGSTAAGLIGGAGYLGATLSGAVIGSIVENSGWSVAFRWLAFSAFASTLAAAAYHRWERTTRRASTKENEGMEA